MIIQMAESGWLPDPLVRFGIRRLLGRAGASVTAVDLCSVLNDADGPTLDRIAEISLVLSLRPEVVKRCVDDLVLERGTP